MSKWTDPHAEVAYWVIPLDKEAFAVEVVTLWDHPTTVGIFASAADAKAWIAAHRCRVRVPALVSWVRSIAAGEQCQH